MAFTWPDVALLALVLISGLMAIMRGFTREVLSLVAWGAAGAAAFYAIFNEALRAQASELLTPYVGDNRILVTIALAAAVFLVVLIILSIIGAKLADALLDTAAGPIDRTLGFFYGLARGLALALAVFIFYLWLVPRDKIDSAVREAASLPFMTQTSNVAIDTLLATGFMSPDLAEDLKGKIGNPATLRSRGDQEAGGAAEGESGYKSNQRRTLDQIIESTQGTQ